MKCENIFKFRNFSSEKKNYKCKKILKEFILIEKKIQTIYFEWKKRFLIIYSNLSY